MIDDPQVLQRLITEVVQKNVQDTHEALRDAMEKGYLFWTIQPPVKRYQEYWHRTLAGDFHLIQTPDYLEQRKAGTLPELQCVQNWNALVQGGQPPPDGDLRTYFWALLLLPIFPTFVFEYYAADFQNLEKAQIAKEAVSVGS